jgi:hypothetical protein
MAVRSSWLYLALILAPATVGAQTAPDLNQILARLERLERENRELTEQVRALQAQVGVSTPPLAPQSLPQSSTQSSPQSEPQSIPTIAEKLDIHEQRIEEQAQTKVESSQKFPIRFAGMALFNSFINSKQSGGVDYPVAAAPPGVGHSGATVRQTVLGLEFDGPQAVLGGKVRGSVYMDFSSPGTAFDVHLRTASIQIDWKDRSVVAGLEKPIFNPREPSSLAQVAISPLTGAGNLWLWIPQVRVEQEIDFTPGTGFRAQLGAVQTREIGPYSGTVVQEAARPGVEGRGNFHHKFSEDRRLEFAAGFHASTSHAGGFSIPSNLYSFDWFFNPWKRLEFTGAFYSGQNVAELGSGLRQGFELEAASALAVHSRGGWGQFTLHTLPRLDFHFFTGQVDDRNADLEVGLIGKNLLFGGNAYFKVAPNVLVGMEATQVRTVYLGQGVRINNHYDLALAYLF